MKNLLSYGVFSLLLLLGACRKADNPKIPTLTRVPTPNLIAGTTGAQAISVSTYPAAQAFSANFTVTLKFPNDVPPAKMDVVVRKNGNNTNVKVWQAGITTWPTTITVTGTKIISTFADSIRLDDSYEFGVDIYKADGSKFEAFPLVGAAYGSGVQGEFGGEVTSITYSAICGFTAADFAGQFKVTLDPWADYGLGSVVPVSVVDASTLSIPSPAGGTPLILKVNVNTNEVTVNSPGYGNYGDGPVTVVSAGGSAVNFVSPCKKQIDLSLNYTLPTLGAAYSGGPYKIRFVKQ